jgi:undecaprenyl-diphosphatase
MFDNLFQSTFLGIIQGLGEFLPISSTAHLILIPYFFHWKDPGLAFDVALHFGTLIAVLAFFWRDWISIFKLVFQNKIQNSTLPADQQELKVQKYGKNTLYLLIVATIPGALAGFVLEKKAETIFRHPLLIAVSLALMGLILYLADHYSKKELSIQDIGWKKAIIIGLAQAIAIIPGVSRSGSTMSAALFLGINRKDAARFSFLLSTPIILGASILKLPELLHNGINISIIAGVVFSAMSGYLAIKYLLKFIEKTGYFPFFIYRLVLALIVVVFYLLAVR